MEKKTEIKTKELSFLPLKLADDLGLSNSENIMENNIENKKNMLVKFSCFMLN